MGCASAGGRLLVLSLELVLLVWRRLRCWGMLRALQTMQALSLCHTKGRAPLQPNKAPRPLRLCYGVTALLYVTRMVHRSPPAFPLAAARGCTLQAAELFIRLHGTGIFPDKVNPCDLPRNRAWPAGGREEDSHGIPFTGKNAAKPPGWSKHEMQGRKAALALSATGRHLRSPLS